MLSLIIGLLIARKAKQPKQTKPVLRYSGQLIDADGIKLRNRIAQAQSLADCYAIRDCIGRLQYTHGPHPATIDWHDTLRNAVYNRERELINKM